MNAVMLYITTKDFLQAKVMGTALVEEKLVACVNILQDMHSIYRWKGAVTSDTEAVLIAKTKESLVDRVISRVKQLHTYECPCVVALPIRNGNPEYIKWIFDETL